VYMYKITKEESKICGDIYSLETQGAEINMANMKVKSIPVGITYSSNNSGSTLGVVNIITDTQITVPFEAVAALMEAHRKSKG